ncbi:cyclic nucleotide-binding and patatin-like phospholipase domain-containing protein [Aquabacterium sp.]|uniref:cyclic nucleotide-binding and patatin-like phospholipase domain-containing protein n=1 Tax=Aquabacterium sp. TaxID=1872578 RepID=UPI002B7E38B4|nr:cyclic nucleotide-binding and patatin-like phospholipase domain-containing protein [Aquabacterium sp.]HSW05949.1 cyclic nucleotide-binding and patatin-like phospholipase domain-containing protein [Aquabacterium sp.]
MESSPQRQPYHDELLYRLLQTCFGDIDDQAIALLWNQLEWVEVAGGEVLIEQGQVGDAMYLLVSGRLRAYIRDEQGTQRMVGEITRGEIVGEMSLYTDGPRLATVLAIRDSVLVRLAKSGFDLLLASNAMMSRALTRQIIRRLKAPPSRTVYARPITIGLLPVSSGVDLTSFAAQLAQQLSAVGRVEVIDSDTVERELHAPEATLGPQAQADVNRRIAMLLDRIEARAEFVLLVADSGPSAWTARCCRDADELLLLADATQPPVLHATEKVCLVSRSASTEAAEILVLLHAAETPSPRGTKAWLDRRPVADHLHIRPSLERDMARLARFLSRTATGLVMAGGGARGLAHLGVVRALQEHGVAIDCVGGTSIGAVMATYVASDRPWEQVMANARRAFSTNPTGDFNPVPWLSLFRGLRLRRILNDAVHELLGFDADIEDLWKSNFCIATNYSHAREQVLRRGRLVKMLLASTSIPGALPPVLHEGDLLCDGGSFNNFPVDVMQSQRGIGTVIGIDLDFRQPLKVDLEDVPSGWALFVDQWRPLRKRRYRLPSLPAYLMTVMVLYSISRSRRSRALTDLYFNPPLDRVGLLQWHRFDRIVQRGYEHGMAVLNERVRAAAAAGAAVDIPAGETQPMAIPAPP